jgi:hypothetical protein
MFSKTSEFKIASQGPTSEPKTELERLQHQWARTLEECYQSKLLKIIQLIEDGRPRLFYIVHEESKSEPLKTTMKARCLRDDLSLLDVSVVFTTIPHTGVKTEPTFTLIPDPKSVGVDVLETVKLVHRTIRDFGPVEGGE